MLSQLANMDEALQRDKLRLMSLNLLWSRPPEDSWTRPPDQ